MHLRRVNKKGWTVVIKKPPTKKHIKQLEDKLRLVQSSVFEWHIAIHKATWENSSLVEQIAYAKKQRETYNASKVQKAKPSRKASRVCH